MLALLAGNGTYFVAGLQNWWYCYCQQFQHQSEKGQESCFQKTNYIPPEWINFLSIAKLQNN
jgi:hypothetical protein